MTAQQHIETLTQELRDLKDKLVCRRVRGAVLTLPQQLNNANQDATENLAVATLKEAWPRHLFGAHSAAAGAGNSTAGARAL